MNAIAKTLNLLPLQKIMPELYSEIRKKLIIPFPLYIFITLPHYPSSRERMGILLYDTFAPFFLLHFRQLNPTNASQRQASGTVLYSFRVSFISFSNFSFDRFEFIVRISKNDLHLKLSGSRIRLLL